MPPTENNLPFDVNEYYNLIAKLESQGSGDYGAKNRLGYLGRYQMGAKALADIGMVKPGTTNKGLTNPNNWLSGSYKEFMNSPELQDNAARMMLEKNYNRALKSGVVSPDMPAHEVAGHLAGIHLVGHTGYKKSLAGEDIKDANKVSPLNYFNFVSERMMPVQRVEDIPAPAPEAPWWENPLQAGRNYLRKLFD